MRFLLGILVVLIFACVVGKARSPFYEDREDCRTLEVENRNFADVTVYWADMHQRIGMVTGLTSRTFEVCEPPMRPAVFTLDAVGGAFELDVATASGTLTSRRTTIVVQPSRTARGSFVIGG